MKYLVRALDAIITICGVTLFFSALAFVMAWIFIFPVIGFLWSIGWI